MSRTKRHWLLNLLIFLSVAASLLAFAAHYQNWMRLDEERLQLLSGLYYREVPFSEIDSLSWTDHLPQMERDHGFSVWAREKGRFRDSLFPGRPIYVFVDDLRQPKLKISYRDSLTLFLNFPDSMETRAMYELLARKAGPGTDLGE
jgi:hypothetical protein